MAAQYRLENGSVIHQHNYTGETTLADAVVHSFPQSSIRQFISHQAWMPGLLVNLSTSRMAGSPLFRERANGRRGQAVPAAVARDVGTR